MVPVRQQIVRLAASVFRMGVGMPDFIVIGAMKAGTTTLFRHLQSHPQIFMPELKEPDFFVTTKNWSKGFDWYASLFAGAPSQALTAEASTNYSKRASFPEVAPRIRKYIPEVKIIYVLRDPLERIRSQYVHSRLTGGERRPPEQAVTPDSGYVDTSLYGAQVQCYLDHFPREQISVVLSEHMRDDPGSFLAAIESFLGVEPFDYPDLARHEHVSDARRANTRIASAIKHNERVVEFSRRMMPVALRERVRRGLTKKIDTRDISVSDAVLKQSVDLFAADRELLIKQWDLDLSTWAPLP